MKIELPPIVTPEEAMKPDPKMTQKAIELVNRVNGELKNLVYGSKVVNVYEMNEYVRSLVLTHFRTQWNVKEEGITVPAYRGEDYFKWTFSVKPPVSTGTKGWYEE